MLLFSLYYIYSFPFLSVSFHFSYFFFSFFFPLVTDKHKKTPECKRRTAQRSDTARASSDTGAFLPPLSSPFLPLLSYSLYSVPPLPLSSFFPFSFLSSSLFLSLSFSLLPGSPFLLLFLPFSLPYLLFLSGNGHIWATYNHKPREPRCTRWNAPPRAHAAARERAPGRRPTHDLPFPARFDPLGGEAFFPPSSPPPTPGQGQLHKWPDPTLATINNQLTNTIQQPLNSWIDKTWKNGGVDGTKINCQKTNTKSPRQSKLRHPLHFLLERVSPQKGTKKINKNKTKIKKTTIIKHNKQPKLNNKNTSTTT